MADSPSAPAPGGWEPLAHLVRVRLTATDLNALDAFAAALGVSRAWFIRRAIAEGGPLVVEKLRAARRAGLALAVSGVRPAVHARMADAAGELPLVDAWVSERRRRGARQVHLLDD